jgi:hypothetical protein
MPFEPPFSIYVQNNEKSRHTYTNDFGRFCNENVSVLDVSLLAFSTGPATKFGNVPLSK